MQVEVSPFPHQNLTVEGQLAHQEASLQFYHLSFLTLHLAGVLAFCVPLTFSFASIFQSSMKPERLAYDSS